MGVTALALGVICAGCATLGAPAGDGAVLRAKDRVAPALVHIRPVKEVFTSGERQEYLVEGSGFIISPDGYVVTNEHVAGESNLVRCTLFNREEVDAEVVGTDRYTDLAVLRLVTNHKNLPTVRLGSSASLEAGQTVLAMGSPHGLSRSVSKGIVSVTDRYLGEDGSRPAPYNTWIQTDAAINPGNSGGPLVNLRGEVVGINARKLSGAENVGFAIPVDIAREVIEQLIAQGRMPRSWVGINLQEMTRKTDDPAQRGVVVGDVEPLSPALEAGLQPGDVLLAVNGVATHARFAEDLPAVRKLIADLPIGPESVFTVQRGDQTLDVAVATIEEMDFKGEEVAFTEWSFTASSVTPAIARRARLDSNKGILVVGVQVGGLAGMAGLRKGDVLLSLDEQPIENLAAFRRIYDSLVESRKRLVLIDVKRGALTQFVLLKQELEEVRAGGAEAVQIDDDDDDDDEGPRPGERRPE